MTFVGALIVAITGALGAATRFWVSGLVARRIGELFPWGTIAVNVSGALIVGAAAAVLGSADSLLRLAIITGFLGGYTTVSSFALQTLSLARVGEFAGAAANIAASAILCLGGAAAGFETARFLG